MFTTWSGGCSIDDFIKVSKEGFKNGDRIMHECCGFNCELKGDPAVGKLKTVRTPRFLASLGPVPGVIPDEMLINSDSSSSPSGSSSLAPTSRERSRWTSSARTVLCTSWRRTRGVTGSAHVSRGLGDRSPYSDA